MFDNALLRVLLQEEDTKTFFLLIIFFCVLIVFSFKTIRKHFNSRVVLGVNANQDQSPPPPPPPLSNSSINDVFLSFRGEDTRRSFTSHLYKALCEAGIEAYIDEESLERGDEISPALMSAIEQSEISIIIFSKNYAQSSWCLRELVHILKCHESHGQIVIPIFYHVDPSDIRKQQGSYGEAFVNHEKRFKEKMNMVQGWRTALENSANLSGWDLSKDRSESKLIEEIVKDVLSKLNVVSSSDSVEGLIGIEKYVKKIKRALCIESEDVRVVGIWGMGGIGKTTIAGVVFNQLSYQFNSSCFLANVKEEVEKHGIISLRDKLLSQLLKDENIHVGAPSLKEILVRRLRRRKVLVVLDDVNDYEQYRYLAGDDWFGSGSRIIITTRDFQLLIKISAHVKFEIKKLSYEDALRLFELTVFKKVPPTPDYLELSEKVVLHAGGVPLVIEILGSYLRSCISKGVPWELTLDLLKDCSPDNVQKKLTISYDALNKMEKAVFLDIACFFKGKFRDSTADVLENLYSSANMLIENLVDKSLVSLRGYKKELWMHDVLQELGWEIVHEESKKLGKRSRLWITQEICQVLEHNKGTEGIEEIVLDMHYVDEEINLSATVFEEMSSLKMLIIYRSDNMNECKVHLPNGLQSLPRSLRYFEWYAFPANSLPSKSMLRNLIELKMPRSQLEQLWDESIVQRLENLKRIDISYSKKLTRFPNLCGAPNLEILNFEHCTSLLQVPPNHLPDELNKLICANLSQCESLTSLPDTIVARALQTLNLNGCSSLEAMPEIIGTNMKHLYLDFTAIKEVPSSIGSHKNLSTLSLEGCKCLENLPSSIHELECIDSLLLIGCSSLEKIPTFPKNIKELGLTGAAIKEVSSSVECLFGLESIALSNCIKLESLPTTIFKLRNLTEIILSDCSNFSNFPEILEPVESLKILRLDGTGIKQLPSSIVNLCGLDHLDLSGCKSLESLPNKICVMHSLRIVKLANCTKLESLPPLAGLTSLESLNLSGTSIGRIPSGIKRLPNLQVLRIKNCKKLQVLPELPLVLEHLDASDCSSLEKLSNSENILSQGAGSDDYHIKEQSVVSFLFYGCSKLDSNHIMINFRFRVLRRALRNVREGYQVDIPSVNSCYPGTEVPKWFNYQFESSSITMELPQKSRNTNFLGFVLCAVVNRDDYSCPGSLMRLSCDIGLFNNKPSEKEPHHWRFNAYGDIPTLSSPHIFMWFQYQMYGQDAKEASFDFFIEERVDKIYMKSTKTKVIRCGICMLYRQDGEEFGFTPYQQYLIEGPSVPTDKPESSGRKTMNFDLFGRLS